MPRLIMRAILSPQTSHACRLSKRGSQICVLIVDDDASIRDLLRAVLENEGYQCVEAEEGLNALHMLRFDAVDLMISDLDMPRMNGIEFIQAIHHRFQELAPPAILASGASLSHLQRHAIELGISEYFTKPYHVETLLNSVNVILTPAEYEPHQ